MELEQKLCYLSAKDSRRFVKSEGMADGFNEIYKVLPEPFNSIGDKSARINFLLLRQVLYN